MCISFARPFTRRRRKNRCILLLRLAEFISSITISRSSRYRTAKGAASFSNSFIYLFILWFSISWVLFLLLFGENPQAVAYSAQPLCWSGWGTPPPPLTGEQYGKMEPKYPEGGHCQSVLRHRVILNVPLYFNNSLMSLVLSFGENPQAVA